MYSNRVISSQLLYFKADFNSDFEQYLFCFCVCFFFNIKEFDFSFSVNFDYSDTIDTLVLD